jgi:hypothetical protein
LFTVNEVIGGSGGIGVVALPPPIVVLILLLIIHVNPLSFCLLYPLSYPSSFQSNELAPWSPSESAVPSGAKVLILPLILPILIKLVLIQFNFFILTLLLSLDLSLPYDGYFGS